MNKQINDLYKTEARNMKELDILENERFRNDRYEYMRKAIIDVRKGFQQEINSKLEVEFKKVLE